MPSSRPPAAGFKRCFYSHSEFFMKSCVALIVAAGSGERFGGDIPKQYQDLAGSPILRRSVLAFLSHPQVGKVQVVINPQHRDLYDAATAGLDLPEPVSGGSSRQDSVRLGLEALAKNNPDLVLIHDAARPLIDEATISNVCAALETHPAAIAAKPLVDTLKRGQDDVITGTIDRSNLWQAHTPQGFRYDVILDAHRKAVGQALTDDAAVAEQAGMKVALIHSNPDNLKLTNPDDLDRARRLLGMGALPDVRTGMGFDVHRLIPGDHITICGHTFAHDHSLEGHSDADVGLHALTDALLATFAAGDIGMHFPPSDPKWKGADSKRFLQHAVDLLQQRSGAISHVDVTIMCERPKIGPQREAMQKVLAGLLKLPLNRVSIKATTTERLGFTGRGEGIAAQAIATVRFPFLPDAA
jgi:2-C-methyl-D-erythritol 4-phosphate cytidylyltransferase/2-C-methyl-D-erythritol 2,4-cyclodiphosphate synthase